MAKIKYFVELHAIQGIHFSCFHTFFSLATLHPNFFRFTSLHLLFMFTLVPKKQYPHIIARISA